MTNPPFSWDPRLLARTKEQNRPAIIYIYPKPLRNISKSSKFSKFSHSSNMAFESTFHPFPRLPRELRLKIWGHTLQPRYIRLNVDCTWTMPLNRDIVPSMSAPVRDVPPLIRKVSSLSFISVVENCSRLPVATRVNQESREMILPLYPVIFEGSFCPSRQDINEDTVKWYASVNERSRQGRLQNAEVCILDHFRGFIFGNLFRGRQEYKLLGARINAELDTLMLRSQDEERSCQLLPTLYAFATRRDKASIKHLALDSHIWKTLLANKSVEHGFKDILAEYANLQSLCIFGISKKPIGGRYKPIRGRYPSSNGWFYTEDLTPEEQEDVLEEEVQTNLSNLGAEWSGVAVTVKRTWEALTLRAWAYGAVLHKRETLERKRLAAEEKEGGGRLV
jgi:2EXR family